MAKALSPDGPRRLLVPVRVTATEQAQLREVAAARALTVSDLVRQALRREGALPAQNA